MDSSNPYQSPEDLSRSVRTGAEPLSLSVALLFVLRTAGIFAVIGAVLGLLIGLGVPQYYREVFNATGDPNFYPPLAGLLLGVMQGGMLGVFAGLVLVGIVAWSRRQRAARS